MKATLETAIQLATAIASNGSSSDLRVALILQTLLDAARDGTVTGLAHHIAEWHAAGDAETAAIVGIEAAED